MLLEGFGFAMIFAHYIGHEKRFLEAGFFTPGN